MNIIRLCFLATALLVAGTTPGAADVNRDRPVQGILDLLPADAHTDHVLKTQDGDLPYTATAGTIALRGQDGKVSARIFYTAYVATTDRRRPLTFAFNGGPGAASAYLHLGLAGPRLVDFGPEGRDGTAARMRDNPESWLRFTDLVFIDPVGTGWSRPAGNGSDFYGVSQDADALAKFIALYVQRTDRAAAPKYLLGESYGGFRAAKVATALKDRQGILVSGIVMVSPMIEASLIFGATDDPLGAALQLPSIAAAELERRGAFDAGAVAEAEQFAMTDYLVTIAGRAPRGPDAEKFYDRVAMLTGVDRRTVERARGFIGNMLGRTEDGRITSPYDAAVTAPDPYPETPGSRSDDPILDGFTRAYGAFFASYARNELNYPCEMTYSLLSTDVNRRWDWKEGRSGTRANAGASDDIRELLATIPSFRLLVMHGYSDVITPYGASRYVLDHLPLALAENRTELTLYRGGHMFYTRRDALSASTEDARAFYERAPRTE
ncbi:MAG: carboxypeptidase [Rhizobium sp.]|nr:carboxypeptidase [Rhizobium sp.]